MEKSITVRLEMYFLQLGKGGPSSNGWAELIEADRFYLGGEKSLC